MREGSPTLQPCVQAGSGCGLRASSTVLEKEIFVMNASVLLATALIEIALIALRFGAQSLKG